MVQDHVLVEMLIVYNIMPSASVADSSQNSSYLDRVLVETLID